MGTKLSDVFLNWESFDDISQVGDNNKSIIHNK